MKNLKILIVEGNLQSENTNFKEGKTILDNSGLKLISAENLDDAANKIVKAIK